MNKSFLFDFLIVILLVLVGCNNKPYGTVETNKGKTPAEISWGDEVNGLTAGISMLGTSGNPVSGIKLSFYIRNTSQKPIRLLKLSSQKRYWGEHLPVDVSVAGILVRYQGYVLVPPEPPSDSEYIYLQPSETDSVEVLMSPENWKLQRLVDVQIFFVFDIKTETDIAYPYNPQEKKYTEIKGLWTGTVRSGIIRVNIGS
jgi:hypothetical protein